MTGIERIQAERERVITKERCPPERDRVYKLGELAKAAKCYELAYDVDINNGINFVPILRQWPATWDERSFKPSNGPRDLEKAGQLYMAEIERLEFLLAQTNSPMLSGYIKEQLQRAQAGLKRCADKLDGKANEQSGNS